MKTKYSFWDLLCNYNIEIPKIQRDYAQGRTDIEIVKLVNSFLDDLRNSIRNNEELNLDFLTINGKISNIITDSKWYFLSWELDPTVTAMLNMLDTIHDKFKDIEEPLFEKLKEETNITFQFLPLEQFKLTDELYIKMNARGKPLTEFENFKANFSQYLETIEEKSKLDNEWLDVFWNLETKDNSEIVTENVDDKFFNFL